MHPDWKVLVCIYILFAYVGTSKKTLMILPINSKWVVDKPIPSMYGLFTYICLILMVNVGIIPYMDPMGRSTLPVPYHQRF